MTPQCIDRQRVRRTTSVATDGGLTVLPPGQYPGQPEKTEKAVRDGSR